MLASGFAAFISGMSLGASLILAIGAQNAFVLRQGLKGEHIFWISLFCAISDAVLILTGVFFFQTVAALLPMFETALRLFGAAYLVWFGVGRLKAAMSAHEGLAAGNSAEGSLKRALLTCAAMTWLNPHVYLDTVVFVGSVSASFGAARLVFGFGAVTASFLWFFGLGYGASRLRGLLARPRAWQVVDGAIGLLLIGIAAALLKPLLAWG